MTHRDAVPETLAPSEGKCTRTSQACHQYAELLLLKDEKKTSGFLESTAECLNAAEVREDTDSQPKVMWSCIRSANGAVVHDCNQNLALVTVVLFVFIRMEVHNYLLISIIAEFHIT